MAEQTFLNKNGIMVTNSRFIVHGQTYAMSGITSVKAAKYTPSVTLSGLFFLIGFFVLMGSIISIIKGEQGASAGIIIGLAITGGMGYWMYKNGRPSYQVILSTSGERLKLLAIGIWPLSRRLLTR